MSRNNHLAVRLNERERQILEAMAAQEERSLSDVLRRALREAAVRRGLIQIGFIPNSREKTADFVQ